MKEQNDSKESRRNFIKVLGLAGTASLTGAVIAKSDDKPKGSGEKVKLLDQNQNLVEVDKSNIIAPKGSENLDYLQKRGREGIEGKKFVMIVDLAKCKNARKCMKACQSAHQLKPEQHHINVLETDDPKTDTTYFLPKLCNHCDNPPCVSVCPVDATFKRKDGVVLIDNERCIGCRFCIAACPYSARTFNWIEPRDAEKFAHLTYDMERNVPQKKGTVSKCVFSADRIREGKLPSCASACPNGVYYFGDENEDLVTNGTTKKTVRLSKLLTDNGAYTLMPELGTKPNVYYLPHRKEKS